MSNTNHDFIVKNGLVVGSAITSTGTLTQAGQTFPASDGSANQYLKTNGSGALSWGTVNTSFNITDGTTTDAVGLTETVTFTGGTNISLAVTDNTVTITNDVTDTDDITEGSSNLFYTDTRAVDAVEGHAHLTIDGGTLYVDTANNYVGIGDTSPSGKLDVAGNIMINGSEVINASGSIVGAVADSAMTVGGSLAGVLSNIKVQYGTSYSGTPIQGSFFFDSLNQKLKVYTGSAFIDAVPAGSGGGGGGGATDANTTFRNYSYTLTGTTSAVSGVDDNELTAGAFIIGHKYTITATGNTNFVTIGAANSNVNTVFTATGVGTGTGTAKQTLFYDTTSSATRVVAYVNGIKQVYGSGRDFVATTGTSVAFTYNLGSGDTVDLQVYELLTNAAYYVKSEVYTQAEVNSQINTGVSSYLPLAGGTLTGDLQINSDELKLYNAANNNNTYILAENTGAGNAGLRLKNNQGEWTIVANDRLRFIDEDSSTERLSILSNGNVGIGTNSPTTPLHVNGTAIIGSDSNQSTSAIAGLHVLDNNYSHWSTTLSKQQVALRVETYWNAAGGGRAVDAYGGGIGFNHLGGHSGTHDENVHAWVGLRVEDTPSHERSNLVFATNDNVNDEDAGILERMCITPAGDVGIGTKEPVARLDVTSNDATAMAIAVRGRTTDNISEMQFYDNAGSARYARIGARPTDTDGLQLFGWGRDINMYTAPSINGSSEKRFTIKKDGAIVHHGNSYGQWVETMMTPSGVVRNVQFISDRTGTWIVVAKVIPSTLNATQTSYDQISVGFNNTDGTQWSAAFGDYMPSEVRFVSSDNWANDWRGYRQIDWIYGVPNNRPWKQFILDGNTTGMTHGGDIFGNGNRWGFTVAGAYDGFGEWHNPLMNFMRMSDGNSSIQQTFFTTPSTMTLHQNQDGKFSVSKLRTAAGQDGYSNGSIGYDDDNFCKFQSSVSETYNHVSSNKSDAIVYICLKLADHYKEN